MAYKRLNLQDGDVLDASHIQHIEDGIAGSVTASDLPFGIQREGITIEWDGETTGKVSVGGMFYKVSDYTSDRPLEEYYGMTFTTLEDGVTETVEVTEDMFYVPSENFVMVDENVVFVLQDNSEHYGMTFAEKGVYFVKGDGMTTIGCSVPEIIKPMENKYLPEALQFGEPQEAWIEIIPQTTMTFEWDEVKVAIKENLVLGDTYIVEVNGQPYECECYRTACGATLGCNPNESFGDSPYPFTFHHYDGSNGYMSGTVYYNQPYDGTGKVTIRVEHKGVTYTPLDPKYLSFNEEQLAALKGEKGEKGEKGADGKTPVKGTDYFTSADKTEMVNSVIAALPKWTGGSY